METLLFQESIEIVLLIIVSMIVFKNNNVMFTLSIVILLVCLYLYRFPKRFVSKQLQSNEIISPCDGYITEISLTNNNLVKICISLNIMDVHIQWYPVNGIIKNIFHKEGQFNMKRLFSKSKYNEKLITILQNEYGVVRVDQIAGQFCHRIVNWSISNSHVSQGEPMGMIKFSSRVDVYLPNDKVKIICRQNDTVQGVYSSIAKWIL